MKRTIYSSIALACALLVSACGGGSDADNSEADVLIYGPCGNTPIYPAADAYLIRWRHFPLTVYVDLSSAPNINQGNNREMYTRVVQTGLVGWTAVGNGIGAIRFVNTPIDADITLRFGDATAIHRSQGGTGNVAGITVSPRDGRYILKGTAITLDVSEFARIMTLSGVNYEDFVGLVTLHEMGHALFVSGHPKTQGNAMSTGQPFNTKPGLSQLDVNSIRESYCKAR